MNFSTTKNHIILLFIGFFCPQLTNAKIPSTRTMLNGTALAATAITVGSTYKAYLEDCKTNNVIPVKKALKPLCSSFLPA